MQEGKVWLKGFFRLQPLSFNCSFAGGEFLHHQAGEQPRHPLERNP